MDTTLSNLFSGIDSAHVGLLGLSIAAEGAVAWGIWLESPKIKTCRDWLAMGLVLGGVVVGAICTIALFVFDEGTSRTVAFVAQDAHRTAADQGVTVVQQQSKIDEYSGRIAQLELKVKGIEVANATPRKPLPIAVPGPPTSLIVTRGVGPDEARIIRSETLPGPTISIIPFVTSLEPFANELASAFEAVPGAQVVVGRGNMITNGQNGLIVQYDHTNQVSVSVFNALVKAGLSPIDGTPVSGSVVYIKVASL
jgi:hypothetical protein